MASLVDSSVWVALYLEKDPNHQQAARVVSTLTTPLYLPYAVLEETATVLTYKHSKEQANRFVSFVVDADHIIYLDPSAEADIATFLAVQSRISFTDAVLLGLSKQLGVELVTFDKQLARLARKRSRKE